MSKAMQDAFQDALEGLADGESLEAVINSNPQLAGNIQPLLETALSASTNAGQGEPEVGARERSRTRMLQYAAQHRSRRVAPLSFWTRWRFSFAAFSAAAIVLLSSTGIWVVSAQSLPGDPFYAIKRRAEELNRTLMASKSSRYDLDIHYRQRRVDEVLRLIETRRVEAVYFEGVLQAQNSTIWDVANVLVILDADTELIGPTSVGDEVGVNGFTTSSGAVLATTIELRRYHLIGIVEAQDGSTWVIADRWIEVSDAIVDQEIGIGSPVEVEVEVNSKGVHKALLIESLEITPTPEAPVAPSQTTSSGEVLDSKDEAEYRGTIESMSGSAIVVNGQKIYLGYKTEIDGILTPGAMVSVDAVLTDSGTWIAVEIKVEEIDELDDDDLTDPEEKSEDELDPDEDEEPDEDDSDDDD
jgi:hypothetical protein